MQLTCAEAVSDLKVVLTVADVPEIRRTLQQIRPDLAEESLAFRAAVLLLTGPTVSFNIDRLACRTQIPRTVVAACTRRLFDNGVWQPDGPVYAWRSPDDAQFWSDVGVAEGQLCRRTDPLGRIEWAGAGAWRKAYEFSSAESAPFSIAYSSEPDHEVVVSKGERASAAGGSPPADPVAVKPVRTRVRPLRSQRQPEVAALEVTAVVQATWLGVTTDELFPGAGWLQ